MGSIRRYTIYAACYVALGLAVLLTHYYQTSAYSRQTLDENITLVAASHFSLSQLVDNLPSVFRENPHAAALKLSDLKGSFLGAMFDSRRMSAAEYKQFLDTKSFQSETAAISGYTTHIWESKRRKIRIVALSLPRAQFTEYLSQMGRSYSLHYIIPLYLLAGALGLFALHFLTGSRRPPQAQKKTPAEKLTLTHTAPPVAQPAKPRGHAWQIKPGTIAESTIREALGELRQMTGATCVSLFTQKSGWSKTHWQGVTELRGALVVRGDSMEPPVFSDQQPAATSLLSPDGLTWHFFDSECAQASLCFSLRFARHEIMPGSEMRMRITDFVRSRARSLMVEHYYENSILDAETGLYSNPYAMFSVKERLLAGKPFATAAMRFQPAVNDQGLSARNARTAIRVMREHFAAEEAPVIARGNENTLVIVFAANDSAAGTALKALQQLHGAYRAQGRSTASALVEDSATCGTAQRLLKTLEALLGKSATSGTIELYRAQEHLRIL